MSDSISVRGLRVDARIGVTAEERATRQPLVFDVTIEADLAPAGRSDDLADTIDYDSLVHDIAGLVRETEVKLLETIAELVVRRVSKVKGANGVTVEVFKENVPVQEDVGAIAVRIERKL
jgi:dihydroneopterin aldolase